MAADGEQADVFYATDFGQESALGFLQACAEGRPPSLLLTGPEGTGKECIAIDFARRLCCTRTPACTQ